MAIGEGPVVHVTPTEIDWGQTPVLTTVTKIVTLSNESLIPAPFCCTLVSVCYSILIFISLYTFI